MINSIVPNEYLKYPKNIPLIEALKQFQQEERKLNPCSETSLDVFISNISKDKKLASFKVSSYVNRGSSAIVFETPEGDILKLSHGNHFPLNRPHASFDVPIKKQGKAGSIFYYIEEKMYQHGISEGFVQIVKDMIKKEGYRVYDMYDFDIHQIGISDKGQLYLLDPECAKYKTIFHAIYDKMKRLVFRT